MNTASAASANRQELYGFIDMLPERSIPAVRSLLEMLSEDYWKPVIETDLTEEELEMLRKDREHRKNHPRRLCVVGRSGKNHLRQKEH